MGHISLRCTSETLEIPQKWNWLHYLKQAGLVSQTWFISKPIVVVDELEAVLWTSIHFEWASIITRKIFPWIAQHNPCAPLHRCCWRGFPIDLTCLTRLNTLFELLVDTWPPDITPSKPFHVADTRVSFVKHFQNSGSPFLGYNYPTPPQHTPIFYT